MSRQLMPSRTPSVITADRRNDQTGGPLARSHFKEARRRGLSNVAPTIGIELDLPDREDPRPVIPSKAELQAIIAGAAGRWRPVILVAIFCGLRASELRGLRWADVDFDARQLNITQRADASHKIGKLKSKAGYRSIPCPPIVINVLREWKLVCPEARHRQEGRQRRTDQGARLGLSERPRKGRKPLQPC